MTKPSLTFRWAILSLFADDEDLQGWRHGAMLTDLTITALKVWRLYRGRADCEIRIKELKSDFGLGSFVLRDFWATEAAVGGDYVGLVWCCTLSGT